jgi:hypothetical protein
MFQKKTVIVVGAGASSEAGFPTSGRLTEIIAGMLDIRRHGARQTRGDILVADAIDAAIRRDGQNVLQKTALINAAWRIRDAMPQAASIDSFIDAHRGDSSLELCGKLAIARSILQAERKSFLFFDPVAGPVAMPFKALSNTWFHGFMQLLVENCRVEELEERLSLICVIDFNYDRCIEHFLVNALQNYYGMSTRHAHALVRGTKILHPYGTVGALPWYTDEHAVGFGAEPSPDQLVDLVSQIKTFTEGTDPRSSDIEMIRNSVAEAKIVLFLGFAYHRQNLELIRSDRSLDPARDAYCLGTAKGISFPDCRLLADELAEYLSISKKSVSLRPDLSCAEFFREYWRRLSLS